MIEISVIGAGGHTRSSLNLLKHNYPSSIINIFDDSFQEDTKEKICSYPLVGDINSIDNDSNIFLSVGNNTTRKAYYKNFRDNLIEMSIFHKLSVVESEVTLGIANQIYAKAYINSRVKIGNNNIINTGATIEHECEIGSHNHISVNSTICGRVKIQDECFIGAGSIINDKISICSNVTIGSGSVVIKSIFEAGTYVGVPARRIN